MPCSSDGYEDYYRDATKMELDKVTRLLCKACKQMELDCRELTGALGKWWKEHKRIDAERLAREHKAEDDKQKRLMALSKLTVEERNLLGLR